MVRRTNEGNEKNKKKNGIGLIIFFIFIVLKYIMNMLDGGAIGVVFAVVAVIVLAAVIVGVLKKTRSAESGTIVTAKQHSHDQLTVSREELASCEGLNHYKIQLDGFLKAGIIDRAEYNVLMRKYREQLSRR